MEIQKIIQEFKRIRKEEDLQVLDEILFEQAIDLYISMGIQNGYPKENTPQKQEKAILPNSKPQFKAIDRPTEKQIYFLNKNKIEIPKTKKEASDLIKKCKESY